MEYIVYKTTCLVNNKCYIGVHATTNHLIFDGYLGCGCYNDKPSSLQTDYVFARAIKKYGPEKFKREILFVFPYTEEGENLAYNKEAELVNNDWIKSNDNYNIALGGKVGHIYDLNKAVCQYALDGTYIKTWRSIKEALQVYPGHIGEVCRGIRKTACEFQWRFASDKIKKLDSVTLQRKTVYQFDLQGNLLKVHKSIYEAAQQFDNVNAARVAIRNNCENKTRQSKGYYWSYKCKFEFKCPFKQMPIACYQSDGTFIKSYSNVLEACSELNLRDYSGIKAVINGKHKLCAGFRWRFFYGNKNNISPLIS